MMEEAEHADFARCPECEETKRMEFFRNCSVCSRPMSCADCMTTCNCGCDKWMHLDCSVEWEKSKFGRIFRWRKSCLLDHAAKLEEDAHESIIIAAKARELAK